MVLTGALEGILFTWLVYYAETIYATATANTLLSVSLLAYIPARLGYTAAVDRIPYLALLLAVLLPAAPALAVAFSGVTGPVLFAAVFVAGAAISSSFPTLSAYAVEAAPEYSGPLNVVTNGSTYLGLAGAPARRRRPRGRLRDQTRVTVDRRPGGGFRSRRRRAVVVDRDGGRAAI